MIKKSRLRDDLKYTLHYDVMYEYLKKYRLSPKWYGMVNPNEINYKYEAPSYSLRVWPLGKDDFLDNLYQEKLEYAEYGVFTKLVETPYVRDNGSKDDELWNAYYQNFNKKVSAYKSFYHRNTNKERDIDLPIREGIKKGLILQMMFDKEDSKTNQETWRNKSLKAFFWVPDGETGNFKLIPATPYNEHLIDISTEEKFYNTVKILPYERDVEEAVFFSKEEMKEIVPFERYLLARGINAKSFDAKMQRLNKILGDMVPNGIPYSETIDGVTYNVVFKFIELTQLLPEVPDGDRYGTFWDGIELETIYETEDAEERSGRIFLPNALLKLKFPYKTVMDKLKEMETAEGIVDTDILAFMEANPVVEEEDLETYFHREDPVPTSCIEFE